MTALGWWWSTHTKHKNRFWKEPLFCLHVLTRAFYSSSSTDTKKVPSRRSLLHKRVGARATRGGWRRAERVVYFFFWRGLDDQRKPKTWTFHNSKPSSSRVFFNLVSKGRERAEREGKKSKKMHSLTPTIYTLTRALWYFIHLVGAATFCCHKSNADARAHITTRTNI